MSEYIITTEQLNWFLERMDETVAIPAEIAHLKPLERTCRNVGDYIDGTRFKCPECGYNGWTKWAKDGKDRVPNNCPNCGARVLRDDA